jgi:hypothetical protein
MPRFRKASLALALPGALLATSVDARVPTHQLDNGTVQASITESIGGRLLSFSLAGKPNFLRLDETAGDPAAPVDARADNVGYLGFEIWAGPQKQWWMHQHVNAERAASKAGWPPDPYLSLAKYKLGKATAQEVVVESPASPVNGLQLKKRYALVEGKPNSLQVDVSATNRRHQNVAWDIWFNTRVRADTQVYVPVASKDDVHMQPVEGEADKAPLTFTYTDRIFSLDVPALTAGQPARNGKVFIQPADGWMAGFHSGQAFIVQFAHQPRSAIHPDQGQIELYNDFPLDLNKGLMEMEVHAPYVKLAPGHSMRAGELWTILPYDGAATREAHVAFLRAQAGALGLKGL